MRSYSPPTTNKKRLEAFYDSDASEDERARVKRKEKRRVEKERESLMESKTGVDTFVGEYTKKGGVREWDKGK
jgi:hypothetical protein